MSLPVLFLVLAGAAMSAALAALWNSLRVLLGGGPRVAIESVHELPEHAQLLEEKNALLRAIKDLEYERAVGKIGEDDFRRLDAAYRARAKCVLAELEADLAPFRAQAETLVAGEIARRARRARRPEQTSDAAASADAPPDGAVCEGPSLDEVRAGIEAGAIDVVPEAPASWPEDAKKLWRRELERALAERRARQTSGEGRA